MREGPAFPRYAVYYAPNEGETLWSLGSAWLGRDAHADSAMPHPEIHGFSPGALAALTVSPRRYGLHATIKAPIHLAEGSGEAEFLNAARDWAADDPPFDLPGLAVGTLGGFVALLPTAPCLPLHDMAGRCVLALDRFRAPLGNRTRPPPHRQSVATRTGVPKNLGIPLRPRFLSLSHHPVGSGHRSRVARRYPGGGA